MPQGKPSPWRTYRHALLQTPTEATHRIVIQDDTIPCPSFAKAAALALAAQPDSLVSFFVGGTPRLRAQLIFNACNRDLSWAVLDNHGWCPAVALAWPVEFIPDLLDYVDGRGWPPRFCADDEIIGRWLSATQRLPLATVPSLVEHPDDVPSLIGRRAAGGMDKGRVAACFIPPERDALAIDWSRGP